MLTKRSSGIALALVLLAAVAYGQVYDTTITVGQAPKCGLYHENSRLIYVGCEGSDSVYVIDPTVDSVVAVIPVGDQPAAMCWNSTNDKIYVTNKELNRGYGSVTVIDAATNTPITTIDVMNDPRDIAWSSVSNAVFCMNRGASSITVIDGETDEVITVIGFEGYPNDVLYNPTNDQLYVAADGRLPSDPGKLFFIDCASSALVGEMNIGKQAWRLTYNELNNYLYVLCIGNNSLWVIDCANNSFRGTFTTFNEPRTIQYCEPPVHRIFVGCGWGHAVHYMWADSLRFQGRFDLGEARNPWGMCYNPHTKHLFVGHQLNAEVTVIEARMLYVIGHINVGGGPELILKPTHYDRIYVCNTWDNTITIIQDFVGIEESSGKPSLLPTAAVPNPVAGGGSIRFQAAGFEPRCVTVIDASGRAVYSGANRPEGLKAPTESGVYFYSLTDGRLTTSGKFAVR